MPNEKLAYAELEQKVRELEKKSIQGRRSADAFKKEKASLEQLFESSREAIAMGDKETGLLLRVNRAFTRLFGYTEEEAVGRKIDDLITPKALRKQSNSYLRPVLKGKMSEYDAVRQKKDGTTVDVSILVTPIMVDNERIGSFAIYRDITKRKEAEKALLNSRDELESRVNERTAELKLINEELLKEIAERRKIEKELRISKDKYQTILENIEDGYYEIDKDGNFTFFNEATCRIFGYPPNELKGLNLNDLTDTKTAKKGYRTFRQIWESGIPATNVSWRIIKKDGSNSHIESSVSTIQDASDKKIGFRGIIRDVNERKQAEQALIESERKYRNLVDNSLIGVYKTNLSGDLLYANEALAKIFGYTTAKEMISENSFSAFDEMSKRYNLERKHTAIESYDNFEVSAFTKKGNTVHLLCSAVVYGDTISGMTLDITERKHAEEEKTKLVSQLQYAQKMEAIGTLAGGVAHDFNNLLMAIQGNVSLMLIDMDTIHPNYQALRNIEKQVSSGAELSSQLLGYARKGKYEVRAVDLNQLVKETSQTLGRTKKDITIELNLAKDLLLVEADKGQIEQVLLNLYVNAVDAMPNGGHIRMETRNITHKEVEGKLFSPKPGNYVLLEIKDTGIGMDKVTQQRVFDPFFTTKTMGRGTGLGMASVYGIVKSHSGYIDVDSKKGRGTAFSIYLPASYKNPPKMSKYSPRIIEGGETILIVDDEEMVLDVGAKLLTALGYTILKAKNGEEALDIYKQHKDSITMVILDMVMPVMGGGEAFDQIRKIDPQAKVLLASGYSLEGEASEIMGRGCNGFIQKPFRIEMLSKKIEEVLDAVP